MHYLYEIFCYQPLYNGLILFIKAIPWHNAGVAVIFFTILVKTILFPLSQKSIRTQVQMKLIEPELNEIKLKYKDNKQLQTEKIMLLYKDKKINPFSGVFVLFIQLPILIALYQIFLRGGLPTINLDLLYPFISSPSIINMNFLGINMLEKSIIFAFFAALAQFLQVHFTVPKMTPKKPEDANKVPEFKDELARSMNTQMKYVMPVMIFFIAKSFPVVVSLYLITSSLFAIGQEFYVRKNINK